MRIGFSWPLGRGRRMWISGGPVMWLIGIIWLLAAYIVAGVLWVIVALLQVIFYFGPRAIYRAIRRNR
jgi:hypothetical protein